MKQLYMLLSVVVVALGGLMMTGYKDSLVTEGLDVSADGSFSDVTGDLFGRRRSSSYYPPSRPSQPVQQSQPAFVCRDSDNPEWKLGMDQQQKVPGVVSGAPYMNMGSAQAPFHGMIFGENRNACSSRVQQGMQGSMVYDCCYPGKNILYEGFCTKDQNQNWLVSYTQVTCQFGCANGRCLTEAEFSVANPPPVQKSAEERLNVCLQRCKDAQVNLEKSCIDGGQTEDFCKTRVLEPALQACSKSCVMG